MNVGVNDSWGGNPFKDLQKLMDHLAKIAFVDMNKAVLVGGSYAGYMISWCFGHDIIKKVYIISILAVTRNF